MIISARTSVVAIAACAALLVAGCSSSGGSSPAPTTANVSGTSAPPPTSPPASTAAPSSPGASASGSPADAATTKAVSEAYSTFFSSTSTVARSQAALQHGSAFHQVLEQESNSSASNSIDVHVTGVRLLGDDLALVTFTIKAGTISLPDTQGHAVKESGHWKVAAQTFCNLLQLQGTTPAPCKDPTVTELPD
jgi:hypothetical protein